jgi:hypothetical protein
MLGKSTIVLQSAASACSAADPDRNQDANDRNDDAGDAYQHFQEIAERCDSPLILLRIDGNQRESPSNVRCEQADRNQASPRGEIPIAQAADVSGTVGCDWGMGDSVNELSGKAAASADPDEAWGALGLAPAGASGGVLFSLLAGEEDLGSASVCAGVSLWRPLRPKEPTSCLYVVDMARRIGSLNG